VKALSATLRASQPDWQARYLWSGTSGQVATLAAFAFIRLGRPAEAAAALREGRTLMLTERLTTVPGAPGPGRPGVGPVRDPAGATVYLFSTPAGTAALVRDDGEWGTIALPGLARGPLVERAYQYTAALDAYHRHPGMAEEIPDRALVVADPSLSWAEWEGAAVSAFFPSSAPGPGMPRRRPCWRPFPRMASFTSPATPPSTWGRRCRANWSCPAAVG